MGRASRAVNTGRAPARPQASHSLLESLRGCTDDRDCARDVLRFLVDQQLIRRGFCVALDSTQGRLTELATQGLRAADVQNMLANEPFREALLEVALENHGGGELPAYRLHGRTALVFDGIPLANPSSGLALAAGVLVVETANGATAPIVEAARILGERLSTLQFAHLNAERDRLARENQWLTSILAAVSDPVLFTDADDRILIANASAERLLAVGEEGSEGRRRAVTLNNMLFSSALARTGGTAAARELPLVDPAEGADLLFELMTKPALVRQGELGTVSVLRDVTDLRRASEEIENNVRRMRAAESEGRSERDRLRLLLGSVAEPVLVTDASGDIELMNPPAERLLTVGAKAPEGSAARVKSNDAVITSFLSNLSVSRGGEWRGRVHLLEPRSGISVPMEAVSAEVRSREGGPTAIITILHDLTEAMEKEALYEQVKNHSEELRQRVREATGELAEQNELLRRQALQLEQASAMKSQFLASISHELRTPLNAIISYTQILSDGVAGALSANQKEKLRRVDANARHLLALINDLLDISRIEAGKMPVDRQPVLIGQLIGEVVLELEPLIAGSGLDFEVAIDGDLAPVHTDRQKVKQIVVNLLSNALKFTERGSVRIMGRRVDRGLVLEVVDTGVGISAENLPLIFEAFAQARRRSHSHRGSGLGLAICRRLAGVLGGELNVSSELNRGSVFSLTLPSSMESNP